MGGGRGKIYDEETLRTQDLLLLLLLLPTWSGLVWSGQSQGNVCYTTRGGLLKIGFLRILLLRGCTDTYK